MKVLWVAAAALASSLAFAVWMAGRPPVSATPSTAPWLPPAAVESPEASATPAEPEGLRPLGEAEDGTARLTPEGDRDLEQPPAMAILKGQVSVAHGSLPETVSIAVIFRGLPGEEQETDEEPPDAEGVFSRAVPPGTYELVFRSVGYLPVRVDGIAVSAGEELDGLDVVLERGERVGGRVVNEEDEPVANLTVLVDGHGFRRDTQTNEQGDFVFEGLPRVWEGQETFFRVRATDVWGGADTQTARAGDTGLLLRLAKRGQVSGDVVDEAGSPVPYAAIYVAVPEPLQDFVEEDPYGAPQDEERLIGFGVRGCSGMPECLADGRADEQGHFELPVPEVDGLKLASSGPGPISPGEPRGLRLSPPVPVDARARGVRLVLAPALELHLLLLDPDGTPTEGEVVFQPKAQEWSTVAAFRAHSDAEGNVTLLGWPGMPATLVPDGPQRMKSLGEVPDGITLARRAHGAREGIALLSR
jgi:hypothetical protein